MLIADFLTHASSVLMTLLTFGIYFWLEERNLDTGNVFASLALFSQLTVPLFIFPVIVPIIINAMVRNNALGMRFLKLSTISLFRFLPRDWRSFCNFQKSWTSFPSHMIEANRPIHVQRQIRTAIVTCVNKQFNFFFSSHKSYKECFT